MNHNFMKYISIFLALITIFSCTVEKDCNPSSICNPWPYDYGNLNLKLTNDHNDSILIVLYSGYVDDQEVISEVYTQSNQYSFYLPVGNRYSVEVYYVQGSVTTVALDGGRLNQETFINCEETCYREPNLNLNLRKL